jgi:hypothetical protein
LKRKPQGVYAERKAGASRPLFGTARRCCRVPILDKKQTQAVIAFIHNPVFYTDALFIRIENRVGARSAQ